MFEGALVNDDVNTIMPFPNAVFSFDGVEGSDLFCILNGLNGKVYDDELPKYMYPYKPVSGTLYDVLTDDYNAQRIAEHFGKCITHG